MNADSTGIFIEPTGPLLDVLRERKAWLENAMPGQAFSSHPPHCTLLFGNYGRASDWLGSLGESVARIPAFPVETIAWQQFPNDTLARGGHTVAYRVALSAPLMQLQVAVAEHLAPYSSAPLTRHPLAMIEPFASSVRRFGFPFVGSHWIPHFTIGSPQVRDDAPLLRQLMTGPVSFSFIARQISVWRIDGDRHTRLHVLALPEPRS